MAAEPVDHDASRFTVKPTSDSHFAWLRTRLSLERTLMSWVRTSVSLIAFGFTIVQFFERFGNMPGVADASDPQAPRYLGLAMIAAGILALVVSVWQYHRVSRYLNGGNFTPLVGVEDGPIHTPLYAVSITLILIGVFAFFAVVTRSL
ncbi:DUF202 domain-containing protein [Starkeya sp. ORNL1]|uniref:YidH family protein n=1 Tax=Starkeya sp. ORNL1 TaxID=2709380 RepID=UPI001462C7F7|nr:DUF202 domain-containing protein [Starkeya sp. ORNL1]QJP12643.1 DUF202 domain-containing protein [Starkeya sp. ORNL1]